MQDKGEMMCDASTELPVGDGSPQGGYSWPEAVGLMAVTSLFGLSAGV